MNAQVFVTSYAIGNTQGFATGKWFELSNYNDYDDFITSATDYCVDELGDADPEICFSDWDEIPKGCVSECHLDEAVFDFIALDAHDREIVKAYMYATGASLADAVNDAVDNHLGEFESLADLGEYYAFELQSIELPDEVIPYFDFESYGRDMAMDLAEYNGHFFRY